MKKEVFQKLGDPFFHSSFFILHSDYATFHFSCLSCWKFHHMIRRINHYCRLTPILVIFFLFSSCNKHEEKLICPSAKSLAGTWVFKGFDNGISEYIRANELAEEWPGWIFHTNGKLTDRANSGFCGTPPITYANYKGHWHWGTDSLVIMNSKFWGGDMDYKLEIVSVSAQKLFVKIIY
jgi:hypothetical protein